MVLFPNQKSHVSVGLVSKYISSDLFFYEINKRSKNKYIYKHKLFDSFIWTL